MKNLYRSAAIFMAAILLSGCMALALAPIANSFTDKPTSLQYTTTATKQTVFNAALRAVSQKGTAKSVDRETGMLNGMAFVSQVPYSITIYVEEKNRKTNLRVDTKLEGITKLDFKNSSDLANELVQEIERLIGTKLEKNSV